jgi:hypothetical protein
MITNLAHSFQGFASTIMIFAGNVLLVAMLFLGSSLV